jgi:hypothetical protein
MNKIVLGVGGLALLVTAVPSIGGGAGMVGEFNEMRQESLSNATDHSRLLLEKDNLLALAELAVSRYESGCLPVVDRSQEHYVSLIEGQPVTDSITEHPVPMGTTVCDANGNTGIIGTGNVVTNVAFTGDREVVLRRLSEFQRFEYGMPAQEVNFNGL